MKERKTKLENTGQYGRKVPAPDKRKKMRMMPLTMVNAGEPNVIRKVGGKEETRRFLENLGFVAGGVVTVISEIGGNMIVNVKDSRVAIGKDMANKIMVE